MASSSLPELRLTTLLRQLIVVIALCALLPVAGAVRGSVLPDAAPGSDDIRNSERMIRIKRLRPADPESREIMLAGLLVADSNQPRMLS